MEETGKEKSNYSISNQLPPELLRKLEDIRSEVRAAQFTPTPTPKEPQPIPTPRAQLDSIETPSPEPPAPQQVANEDFFRTNLQNSSHQPKRTIEIDEKSWAAIVRLQNTMNLSRPEEALRVVLAAGCKKLGKFLEIGD